jgi:hypothetical protein
VVKVVISIVGHAKFVHHSPRTRILGNRVGDDLGQPEHFKPEPDGCRCGFGSVTLAPELPRHAPSDLYCWRKVRFVANPEQSYGTNESTTPFGLNRPKTKAVLSKMSHLTVDPFIRPLTAA